MGVKGKLIASKEVKCGEHLIHNLFLTNSHHIPYISPSKINHIEINEGEIGKIGRIMNCRYNEEGEKIVKYVIEAIDHHTNSISRKVIEGDLLELYHSFTFVSSCQNQWATWTIEYEKKIEDTPEPLIFLGFILDMTKDIESHLLKK
ncbi:kirola-like [Solanum pennellii]|uniref:Kirola-like n=1 Tax=Solanum pennellii TaxID=28526 RepID=A0ABM1GD36_SOLPN|nr:kirola-like [Solanum pennellii]